MAFTGSATFTQVSDRRVRVTGLSLGNGANGTIGLNGGTGQVSLPAAFQPKAYTVPYGGTSGADVDTTPDEFVKCTIVPAGASPNIVYVTVAASPLLWTLTNSAAGATSGAFDIWFEY